MVPVLMLSLAGAAGCSKKSEDAAATKSASKTELQTYSVRGIVKHMPTDNLREIEIHHEEMPDSRVFFNICCFPPRPGHAASRASTGLANRISSACTC